MSTLLMRLAGPMQSWGVQSHFTMRDSGLEPSKSGVIGLVCAAMGRPRSSPLDDLAALRFGVRVDQEGKLAVDFHTAQNVAKAGGGPPKNTEISRRYYLADAVFLAGLEGELSLLQEIQTALQNPVWTLYLGRKAFPPGKSIWLEDGLKETEWLEDALKNYPWQGYSKKVESPDQLRMVIEDPQGTEIRPDQPLSFSERSFASRRVATSLISRPESCQEAI